MPLLYENEKCPVCGKRFEADDDVVTCPECGTPHHRECYNSAGGCANGALHSDGFVYKRTHANSSENDIPNSNQTPGVQEKNPVIGGFFNSEGTEKMNNGSSNVSEPKIPLFNSVNLESSIYSDSDEEIDGVNLTDVSMVIGTNSRYFVPKFIKNKKFSWNWSAFVFGPYYLFFRKMHMQGIMFLALQFICRLIVSAVYSKQIFAFSNLYSQAAQIKDRTAAMQAIAAIPNSDEWKAVMPAYFIIIGCMLILNIIIALTVNTLYRKKVINTVKTVNEKVKSGETFSISPMIGMDMNLNQADLKKLFLSKQGGVSTFAPVAAYLILYFVSMFISYII